MEQRFERQDKIIKACEKADQLAREIKTIYSFSDELHPMHMRISRDLMNSLYALMDQCQNTADALAEKFQ